MTACAPKQPPPTEFSLLISDAMHDLRQPVQSLVLLSRVAAQQRDPAKREEAIGHMQPVLTGLLAMLSALGDFAGLEAGVRCPNRDRCALDALIGRLQPELEALVSPSRSRLLIASPRGVAHCDEALLAALIRGVVACAARLAGGADISLSCGRSAGRPVAIDCRYVGVPVSDVHLREVFTAPVDAAAAALALPGLAMIRLLARHAGAVLEYGTHGREQSLTLILEEAPPASARP